MELEVHKKQAKQGKEETVGTIELIKGQNALQIQLSCDPCRVYVMASSVKT